MIGYYAVGIWCVLVFAICVGLLKAARGKGGTYF